jgi:hypothetical protein
MKLLNNKKIVFVLGAGASKRFGFPTGEGLSKLILKGDISIFEKEGWPHINEFRRTFENSTIKSIDAFLEETLKHNFSKSGNFYNLGKNFISYFLLKEEDGEKLSHRQNNWYVELFDLVKDDLDSLIDGRVKFVTFNYDLSLEQYLYQSILYSKFGFSQSQDQQDTVSNLLDEMGIVHLYGQLGFLKWQKQAKGKEAWRYRKYGRLREIDDADTRFSLIQHCADSINLMRNDSETIALESFKTSAGYLTKADYVCFLGFGYNRTNLTRLFENVIFSNEIKYYCSGYQFYKAERKMAEDFFHNPQNDEESIIWSSERDEIIPFMKKYLDFWY